MSKYFALRGSLDKQTNFVLGLVGLFLFFLLWYLLTIGKSPVLASGILPNPIKVFSSIDSLITDNKLIENITFSIGLNLAGYIIAICISLVLGYIIGLYPIFRGLFKNHIDGIRFVPLAAVTGIFIGWFGINTGMKSYFLAFGIIIYLLPVIVQRIDEVKEVYLKTVYTLGATDWQTIKTVYIPSVLSTLFDDIRILTAISWTYIVVAETIINKAGLGGLTYTVRRQGRIDKLFAIIIIIILIGIIQDQVFKYLDKQFFPFKYQTKNKYTNEIEKPSLFDITSEFFFKILSWILLAIYLILVIAEYTNLLGGITILSQLFQDTIWSIHFIFIAIVVYKGNNLYQNYKQSKIASK